jgi:hypothetical protein
VLRLAPALSGLTSNRSLGVWGLEWLEVEEAILPVQCQFHRS